MTGAIMSVLRGVAKSRRSEEVRGRDERTDEQGDEEGKLDMINQRCFTGRYVYLC